MQSDTIRNPASEGIVSPSEMTGNGLPPSAEAITPLPSFVLRRADGLFINPKALENADRFMKFVERIFGDASFFHDLHHANFERLLYDDWPLSNMSEPLRLAADIRSFEPARQRIYKGFATSSDGRLAHYLFELVFIDTDETLDGAATESSPTPLAKSLVATLCFDEFVAHAWKNGVRYGIDAARVREAIEKSERGRMVVASWREPKPGVDAGIEEKCTSLHRDDSPTLLANGQLDLGRFRNRFPQVRAGEPLFRKTPRTPGDPGRKVCGTPVECEVPKDFDIALLAGPGTRLENREDGQTIVAAITGFVDIDKSSHRIAICEKMVGREGVSMRTTGNLRLSGEGYEEYGEVDAKRVIEGKDMTFHANAYGNLISSGGTITIGQNLISGKVSNPGGQVLARGLASASAIGAPGGTLRLQRAEGCVIWANRVEIEHAVCCEIFATKVRAGNAEGCTITTQCADIGVSSAYKGRENAVTLLIPSQEEDMVKCAEAQKHLELLHSRLKTVTAEKGSLEKNKAFGEFLKLQSGIARGKIKVLAEHAAGFRQMHARMAPANQQYQATVLELDALHQEIAKARELLSSLQAMLLSAKPTRCAIASINGETMVQSLHDAPNENLLDGTRLQQIRSWMKSNKQSHQRLYSGDSGNFLWQTRPGTEMPIAVAA